MARRTNATPVGKPGGWNSKMDNDSDLKPDAEGAKLPKEGKKSDTGSDKGPTKGAGKDKGPKKGPRGFASLPFGKKPKKD
jgi:hypothetical protein